jgi:hypothetical protein
MLSPKDSTVKSNASSPMHAASVPSKTTAPESFSSAENSAFTHYETGRTFVKVLCLVETFLMS